MDARKVPWKGLIFLAAALALFGWLLNTPPGILGKADAIAYAVCHRIGQRSFYIGSLQMPLCARCTGMYLGAMLGLTFQSITGSRRAGWPHWTKLLVFGVLVVAFGIDGFNSFLHFFPGAPSLYQPENWLRLLTGSGMGLAIAVVLFPAFNQAVWTEWDRRPAIPGWLSVAGIIVFMLLLDWLVLTENPLILYPVALISSAGVMVLLTLIYSMIWLMLVRQENRFVRLRQMLTPLTAGFTLGLLQIALFDLARFWLTGTWDGFHLG